MSGHELNDVDFISSTHEAELIITWFQKHGINDLLLICGASLGAHVAAEILQKQRTFAQYAMIESLKAYQYKGIILKLFSYNPLANLHQVYYSNNHILFLLWHQLLRYILHTQNHMLIEPF